MTADITPEIRADGCRVDVGRWVSEDGKRTRSWYWETHYGGKQVSAGIAPTQEIAHQRAITALALAAYQAGLATCDCSAALRESAGEEG